MIKLAYRTLFISSLTLILTINIILVSGNVGVFAFGPTTPAGVEWSDTYFGFEGIYNALTSNINPFSKALDSFTEYLTSCRRVLVTIRNGFFDFNLIGKGVFETILGILKFFGQILSYFVNFVWLIVVTFAYFVFIIFYFITQIGYFIGYVIRYPYEWVHTL